MASKNWTKARLLSELEQQEGITESLSLQNYDLNERMAELELGLEDIGWIQISQETEHELTRDGIRRIASLSRMFFLKNPLIRRAVLTQSYYVFGQGVEFKANDESINGVIQEFIHDLDNQRELTGHTARMDKENELQVEGNLFFVLFVTPSDGMVKVRTIPAREIDQIICDPDDSKSPMWYKRVWHSEELDMRTGEIKRVRHTAYYPDIDLEMDAMPDRIGEFPVQTERVYHVKTGALSDMKFGIPETWSGIDWARAYKTFLENWATIQRALSRFAARLTTRGGSKGVTAAKNKLNTTLGDNFDENTPPPVTGSTIVTSPEGVMFEPIRTAGMTTGPEEGRRLLLMVASATGLPETFFGDLSQGNHATALTMDRPTELKMVERREMWRQIYNKIFGYVLLQSDIAASIDGELVISEPAHHASVAGSKVNITWPPILEHEIEKQLDALVKAAELRAVPERLMSQLVLAAFGISDTEEILDSMFPDNSGMERPEKEEEEVVPAANDAQ